MRWIILLLVLLVSIPIAIAAEPLHITLLAVTDEGDNSVGSTADLFLEIREGKERVFLETFPLTQLDTQISTRFAQEIACNYFDLNCAHWDFIYTIKADSTIIGGPSAGASLAALTAAGLLDLPVNEDVAVTGTINSGGLIGPVGGLRAKIEAASAAEITTVLIPFGTRLLDEPSNSTNTTNALDVDLVEYGELLNVTVIEVTNLNEVVELVTGERVLENGASFVVDSEYTSIMQDVSEVLCSRSSELNEQTVGLLDETEIEDVSNRTAKATEAAVAESYYSAASYCFGLNIRLRNLLYEKQNLSDAKVKSKAAQLQKDVERFEEEVYEKELQTITDLQTFTVVIERLDDAKDFLNRLEEEDKYFLLAFAEERFFSAQAWAKFFEMGGQVYNFDEVVLQRSCIEKVQEAEERYQYVQLFLTNGIDYINEDIKLAKDYSVAKEYEKCLIGASQAKANANAILSTIGIRESQLTDLVDAKLNALEALISRTIDKSAFPLLGFSYYEYSKSLRQYDEGSALLYAEYALEMSNLDIYFEEEQNIGVASQFDLSNETWIALAVGFLLGIIVAVLVVVLKPKKRMRK